MAAIGEMLLGEINAKEDLSLRLGDALDVKASIHLAILIFLATQTAYFFDKSLPRLAVNMQLFSLVCEIAAIVFALLELRPIKYILPEPESVVITDRIDELTQFYRGMHSETVEHDVAWAITRDQIAWTKKRITNNQKLNRLKSGFLEASFWFTLGAVVLNVLTLTIFLSPIF
jgi:hypothetical protein